MLNRILTVQLADIGDLILTTPALAALRENYPAAHITLLTLRHAAPVVEGSGLIDEVLTFDRQHFDNRRALLMPSNLRRIRELRQGRYDAVIFFHHFTLKLGTLKFGLIALGSRAKRRIGLQNGNGWFLTDSLPDEGFGVKHQAQYWLDLVGLVGADSSPRPAQVKVAETAPMLESTVHPRIALHPGSGGYSLARRWEAEKFAAVADDLTEQHGAQIILVGGPSDNTADVKAAMKTTPLDLSGKTTLPELAALLKTCDVYIGADSGVMHLAAAMKTPLVALFGPSNHEAYGPWTPESPALIVRSGALCSPCSYVEHGVGLREGCEARTSMKMVTPTQVIEAANRVLSGAVPPGTPTGNSLSLSQRSTRDRLHILGIPVDSITYPQWLDVIAAWVQQNGRARQVCTINPEFVMMAQRDPNFRNILKRAHLCIPDGIGLLLAARWMGRPLPERVTGSDGVPKIAERAVREGWRLFLLGAAPGVAEKAAAVLQRDYPGLQIAGVYSGSPAPDEEDAIVERVNASRANILFVAYGAPNQDKWIARNLPRLKVQMAMGVGGTFDFIAGIIPRAPVWMRRAGLEWLYRLYLQPRRIGRMMRLPRFALAVLLRGSRPR
ncbi:MAG: WecB/TagA/CpsF family glycosyltransferase [bacterium]|nr:WecB/TagA/CpsF family glycosyltransferase [bacterium]